MIHSFCVAPLARPGLVANLPFCLCLTWLAGIGVPVLPLLTAVCICTVSQPWPPECIELSELMSNQKFPFGKTWNHNCFASEAEQAWPPVCRTACLLYFPRIPVFFFWLCTFLPVCVWQTAASTTEGKMRGETQIRANYLSRWLTRPFFSTMKQPSLLISPSTNKKVINWCKFTTDMAGNSHCCISS